MVKRFGNGKSQLGNMDAVLSDTHLDTRITLFTLINVIVPKREYAVELLEADAEFV